MTRRELRSLVDPQVPTAPPAELTASDLAARVAEPEPEAPVEPDVLPEPVGERSFFVPVEGALSTFEVQGSAPPLTPYRARIGRANGTTNGHANGRQLDVGPHQQPIDVPASFGSFNDRLTALAPSVAEPDQLTDPDRRTRPAPTYEPALVDLESVFPDAPEEKADRTVGRKRAGQPRRGKPGGPPSIGTRPPGGIRRFAVPAVTGLLVASVAAAAAFVVITKLQGENSPLRSGAQSSTLAAPIASAPATAAPAPSAAPVVTAGPAKFGVFRGTSRADVATFERWAGRDVDLVVDFPLRATWQDIADPSGLLAEWKGSGYRLVLSTAMLPTGQNDATMTAGARGDYDRYYRTLATKLVAEGQKNAIVRIGWEFNLGSSRWSTKSPKTFIAYWRNIVDTMRSVPGQKFQFDWNVNVGDTAHDGTLYYPGADYVDYIGVDVYDISWDQDTYPYPPGCDAACRLPRQQAVWDRLYAGDGGLGFWSSFAKTKGKPMSIPEWGLWDRIDHHGGKDDPYFIKQMHKFIADPENDVAYQAYFEVSQNQAQHSMQENFPNAGKVFRKLFK